MIRIVACAISSLSLVTLVGCELAHRDLTGHQPIDKKFILKDIFFDDFNYTQFEDFHNNGWKIRTQTGHPGIAGATWSEKGISFHSMAEGAENGILRMSSSTDGTGENTQHTQFCHERKYHEGTYAARVFFRNEPAFGPDGDEVIQTFYAISPLKAPMDENYSEADFEYLPNGGWGANRKPAMWNTTWETFQLEPWTKVNEYTRKEGDYAGWRTLLMTISDNKVRYYVDGDLISEHSEKVYPEEPMSINFNLWFMPKGADGSEGPIDSPELRQYQQDVDWVFHKPHQVLSSLEVESLVADYRSKGVFFNDSVSPMDPPLMSPCGL